jgi:lysyl-tRNA synthetase class 2
VAASWIVMLVGLAFIAVGINAGLYQQVVNVNSRLHRLSGAAPFTLALTSSLTRTALVVIGLLLLMLCHGLRRRKHRSWQAVMALLIVAAIVNLIRHHHDTTFGIVAVLLGFGITAVLIGFGWYYRAEFYAIGDPRTRWRALSALVGLLMADLAIGLAYIAMRGLIHPYTIPERVQAVIYGLVGASPPVPIHFVAEFRGDFFGILTGALGFLTLIVTVYLFLRPAEPVERLGRNDAAAIRTLLDRRGECDSLGYFALRDDKSVIWSPTGKSCIGYRVLSGVMLASGDPLGDAEAWPGAIHAFLGEAARHAWVPAVVGCSEQGAEVWCRDGDLTALELGDEAIVRTADFSLQGRAMRNVRQMVTRVARAGYVAEVRRVGDVPAAELARLTGKAESWRGNPTERGFSMALGRIGGAGDDRCVIVTAMQDGVLRALLHFVPWGCDGLSLDLMRRDRSAQPGLNDFLIVETIKAAQDLGVTRISLNFAAFRAALERGERIGAGPILRAWRKVLLFMSRWFQIESLYKFNAKFCPEWVPRFMVFPGTRDTVRIGLAALEAEAFLVWPTFELRRIARRLRARLRRLRPRRRGPGLRPGSRPI